LAMAHDMTIYGRRDNVMVFREQDGKRQMFVLDLTDTAFMDSPAFYLQQNDMVYVTPNKVRAGQSTINQNNVKSVGFWVTIGNVALTAANFIATLSR
ncbi:MAG: polysaccharide export protein, partial [Bacteroidales bacterium]|nr:polysaccharide export protein [Bacteroidales bacterium]